MAIIRCNCPDASQGAKDQTLMYGAGHRVGNPTKAGGHRCACCGREQGAIGTKK